MASRCGRTPPLASSSSDVAAALGVILGWEEDSEGRLVYAPLKRPHITKELVVTHPREAHKRKKEKHRERERDRDRRDGRREEDEDEERRRRKKEKKSKRQRDDGEPDDGEKRHKGEADDD